MDSAAEDEVEPDRQEKGVHIAVGFFLFANYLIVTTFLGLPFTFFHGGIVTGLLTLTGVGVLSRITVNWELEAMARAQALHRHKETPASSVNLPHFRLTHARKFEIVDLCEIFLGRIGKYGFIVLITCGCFVCLVVSSGVVASTLSVNIPLDFAGMRQCNSTDFHIHVLPSDASCRNTYWFCLFLLAVIVIPYSMVSITKQIVLQIAMGAFRFVTVGTILLFVIVNGVSFGSAWSCDQPWRTDNDTSEEYNVIECGVNSTLTDVFFRFRFDTWITLIPMSISCFTVHAGMPSLSHPLRQKKHLGALLHVVFVVMGLLYMIIGVTIALWWRDCIIENCTLNWAPLIHPSFSLSLRILSYGILLVPNVYIISAYAIVVLIAGSNIYSALTGRDSADASGRWFVLLLAIKFIYSLTPILVAMGVSNFVTVLKFLGAILLIYNFWIPILLQLTSQRLCYKTFKQALQSSYNLQESPVINNGAQESSRLIPDLSSVKPSDLYTTPYSNTIISHWSVVAVMGVLTVFMFIFTIVSMFY